MALLIVSLCGLIRFSFYQGMSSAWQLTAANYHKQWVKAKGSNEKQFAHAMLTGQQSVSSMSNNPEAHLANSRLKYWQLLQDYRLSQSDDTIDFDLKTGYQGVIDSLNKSVTLRPSWPTAWGDLAQVSNSLNGFYHADTQAALRNALYQGRYFSDVIKQVLPVYMANYDKLTPLHLRDFYDLLNAGLKTSNLRNGIMQNAKTTGIVKWVCLQVRHNPLHANLKGTWWDKRHCKGS